MDKSKFVPAAKYLPLPKALVLTVSDTSQFFSNPAAEPIKKTVGKKEYNIVPWGADNAEPNALVPKINKNIDLSTNILFNIQVAYGEGVIPVRINLNDSAGYNLNMSYTPVNDVPEIAEFWENNDITNYWLEQVTDMQWFFNCFPEIILNREAPAKRKVLHLSSKEASFSRLELMTNEGVIKNHFYSAYWSEPNKYNLGSADNADNIVVTPCLDHRNPVTDALRRLGRIPYPDGTTKPEDQYRYIVPVNFPTPGRSYYQRPYWYSVIESGWYDFAQLIPQAKKALMDNKMALNYVVYLHEQYFDWIFTTEGITTDEDKKKRVKQEYDEIRKWLTGVKNQGKALIVKNRFSHDGKEQPAVVVKPVENPFKGGEYIDDSEEVSNILAYGTGVHSSIIGSHGKGGTINGSEARELFTIKQALMRPFRDRLLRPFYLIKKINNWPADVHFICPGLQLTTLDKNTGAIKNTGGPAA